ncbi:E3 ubiquitin-protein ligase parkin-like isoform X2 [Dendronephthya gigantea]|uniref:E3 ubiquitin-protein ligase parkin-like isoform X2 n=2 Tax=Dendronephthya gigantea TaxID=151771 RepID=UPI00106BE138|nr:E3 ubiquitin-protein ligase parkin-like isoform X2 [Dendronephthya gigantea]
MSHDVTVNFNGKSFNLRFQPSWTIAQLKREIARKKNVKTAGIKVIFAGRELPNELTLGNAEMNHSVIHAVQKSGQISVDATYNANDGLTKVKLTQDDEDEDGESQQSGKQSFFFVYCKTCKKLTRGKLRCRCSNCKEGSFVLSQGPNGWDDVLIKGRMQGQCESNTNCQGKTAEFYFKCGEHHGRDEQAPLSMLKSNIRNIPCITCSEISDVILVFPCESKHTICEDCFREYCVTYLSERRFVQTERKGYTIACPGNSDDCRAAFISDPHHFRLLGDEQYERFQTFAAEECVLLAGGVLCPGRGCGQGIFPPQGRRRVTCEHGCGLVFCRNCSRPYHEGECQSSEATAGASASGNTAANRFQVTEANNQRARWNEQSEAHIKKSTKRCPNTKCNVPVEKNAGCNHMTCSRCGFHWCWICRVPWDRKCQRNHWFNH